MQNENKYKVLLNKHGPQGGTDLHFSSPQPDTILQKETTETYGASALCGVSTSQTSTELNNVAITVVLLRATSCHARTH